MFDTFKIIKSKSKKKFNYIRNLTPLELILIINFIKKREII